MKGADELDENGESDEEQWEKNSDSSYFEDEEDLSSEVGI